MSEKRVSNETLGKVVVQVVKDLEKSLKTHEKAQSQQQAEVKQITERAVIQLRQELDRIERFSVDLRPLDDKMNNYLEEINKASEKAQKDLKSPILELKVLGLFFGLFCAVFIFFFFFNEQAKELKKERAEKEQFIEFIKADEKRINEYNKWVKE